MNILVCGGAGYIGAHMCKLLAAQGHGVTVFDNLSTGHAEAVRWGELIRGDLLVRDDIDRALRQRSFSAVMHFSARSLVGESVSRPDLYYQNNVTGTANLLDSMVAHGIKTFIFSSTAAIYGMPQYTPIDEQHPKAPINPYGNTKLMVETMLADYDAAFGLRSVALRYFNACGAEPGAGLGEEHDPETHVIPLLLRAVRTGQPATLFGDDYPTPDGTCIRDYIHVSDLAEAHILAVEYLIDGGASDAFNAGAGAGQSVLEVLGAVEQVTGCKVPYVIGPRRAGDAAVLVADSGKLRRSLHWKPRYTDLRDIVRSAFEFEQKR